MLPRMVACPCRSGLRYKHCCGAAARGAGQAALRHARRREAALALQRQGAFSAAIDAYDAILRDTPADWDVAHMRATCLYQLGALVQAGAAFAALLATPAANAPGYWTNLGLQLSATCSGRASGPLLEKLDAYRQYRPIAGAPAPRPSPAPLSEVSIVMPAYMHEHYVGQAIASVLAQTHAPLEMIVIDDGSTDDTVRCCEAALRDAPFPVHLVARENRGAAATLNEGIAIARGEFIQLLNSDDRLAPRRLATMTAALLERDAEWGYSRVAMIDASGAAFGPGADARAAALLAAQDAALMSPTLGLALLRANSTISSGNLMFRKRLWASVGGFRAYRYNHDWDFCLRAALLGEPVLASQALYDYRIHGCNTITEAGAAPHEEHLRVMADFVRHSLGASEWPNPYAPTLANWDGEFLALAGLTAAVRYLPRAVTERALTLWTGA